MYTTSFAGKLALKCSLCQVELYDVLILLLVIILVASMPITENRTFTCSLLSHPMNFLYFCTDSYLNIFGLVTYRCLT